MCKTYDTPSCAPAQVLTAADVLCDGQQPGDYLVGGHVVTLTQDPQGAQWATCTCDADLFTHPVSVRTGTNATGRPMCPHMSTVWTFLYVTPALIEAAIAGLTSICDRLARIGAPATLQARKRDELAAARIQLRHRLAARPRAETVSAVSLPGADPLPTAGDVAALAAQDARDRAFYYGELAADAQMFPTRPARSLAEQDAAAATWDAINLDAYDRWMGVA